MQKKEWSYVSVVELSCVPVRPDETAYHIYGQKGGAQMKWQARCIIPDCKSVPSTICAGCTRDVRGIVFVCKPSPRKRCWDILHQARSPKLLDAQGNEIERPTLIKKRKRNNSLGVERIPKRQRKSLSLNPHHTQLQWELKEYCRNLSNFRYFILLVQLSFEKNRKYRNPTH